MLPGKFEEKGPNKTTGWYTTVINRNPREQQDYLTYLLSWTHIVQLWKG